MAIYLLNISVDAADPHPDYIPEDLSFNDQESIAEIIIEKVLGFENAFEEYDDHDPEDHNKSNNVKINLLMHQVQSSDSGINEFMQERKLPPHYKVHFTNFFKEIDSPPPNV
ncbi:hypothetical protein [Galbibacter mesophilus]|uniref:hypothetical protein n=1 Tax=Galbibacter mesophilus TaxID=379069 RepID=UPI001F5CE165|nr:hypothetical protein [Galbibacter mesophilus]MCM5664392.1 hypothetical protein [Galbibacter mesophilus]